MKYKLTRMVVMAAVTLAGWNVLAFNNPHITEVDLDIEGVLDGQEFGTATEPGGPGGFVESNGWKKITLRYTVENPPSKIRLNWNSDKIKVYTATNNGTEIPNDKLWDPASDMPSTLYVKGVDVSESGPSETACGPEHMCLEAINNGTAYIPNLYDRVGFTVFCWNIKTKRQDASDWDADGTITEIASGGLNSSVHHADVAIDMLPVGCVSASRPLTIYLTSGAGYLPPESRQWWWPADVHKRALLTLGSSYEFGVSSSPIILLSLTGGIEGTLRSSNKVEPSTNRVEFQGFSLEKAVSFGRGEFLMNLPSTVEPYVWTDMTCIRTFAGIPLAGHRLRILCEEIEQADGTVVSAIIGSSAATSYALESFIWVGEHPSESYNTGEGCYDEVIVGDTDGVPSQFNVQGFHKRVVIGAIDLNSTEYFQSTP